MPDPDTPSQSGRTRPGLITRLHDYWLAPYTRVRTTRYEVTSAKRDGHAPFRIALFSDLHASTRFMPLPRIREVVAQVQGLDADLILFGGDLMAEDNLFQSPLDRAAVVGTFAGLRAKHGVFAVMGNHDWWDDPETQRTRCGPCETAHLLDTQGVRVLENEALELEAGLWLAGLGCQTAFEVAREQHIGVHDVSKALQNVPDEAFHLLLAHEPDIFPALPDRVDLTVSGHTHGGQVILFGQHLVAPSTLSKRYGYGHFTHGDKQLLVTGGLGCSQAPLRFGMVPEIVEITLRGTKD